MFTVTDAATVCLHEVSCAGPAHKTLRLEIRGARFEFHWDQARSGDNVISHDGGAVMVYNEHVDGMINRRIMDVNPSGEGAALTLAWREAAPNQRRYATGARINSFRVPVRVEMAPPADIVSRSADPNERVISDAIGRPRNWRGPRIFAYT